MINKQHPWRKMLMMTMLWVWRMQMNCGNKKWFCFFGRAVTRGDTMESCTCRRCGGPLPPQGGGRLNLTEIARPSHLRQGRPLVFWPRWPEKNKTLWCHRGPHCARDSPSPPPTPLQFSQRRLKWRLDAKTRVASSITAHYVNNKLSDGQTKGLVEGIIFLTLQTHPRRQNGQTVLCVVSRKESVLLNTTSVFSPSSKQAQIWSTTLNSVWLKLDFLLTGSYSKIKFLACPDRQQDQISSMSGNAVLKWLQFWNSFWMANNRPDWKQKCQVDRTKTNSIRYISKCREKCRDAKGVCFCVMIKASQRKRASKNWDQTTDNFQW